MRPILVCLLVAGLAAGGAACGGGSSGSTSSGASGINTLSDVPTNIVDPSAYDLSTNTASSSVSAAKAAGDPDSQNTFSRAGCEANRIKKNIIREALMPKMILCMMKAFEAASGETAAGDGVFKYWRAPDGAAGQGPPGTAGEFKPRMAVKKSGGELTFVMCNDTTKHVELVVNLANGRYDGHVVAIFSGGGGSESFQNRLDFSADGIPTSAGGEGFTTATFTQSMVEASTYWNGVGSATFEATPAFNIVHGFHNEQGVNSYAGSAYAKFDKTQGTAKFKQDSQGSYPAPSVQEMYQSCLASPQGGTGTCGDLNTGWLGAEGWLKTQCNLDVMAETRLCHSSACNAGEVCCPSVVQGVTCTVPPGDEKSESFTISVVDAANLVLSFSTADSSAYAADVAAATLPSSSAAPSIAFTSASADVDCSASASWTLMAPTQPPDISACQAIEAQMSKWDVGDICLGQQGASAGGANAVQ